MASKPQCFVGIPAYNEEKSLGTVIREVVQTGLADAIIVVDDASTDGTGLIARSFPQVRYVRHETNQGIGGAQKSLFDAFLKLGASEQDYIVFLHADGQMRVDELARFVDAFRRGDAEVVLGSRLLGRKDFRDERRRPFWKILGDLTASKIENLAFGLDLTSYGSGYRGWTRRAVSSMDYAGCRNRVSFDVEIIAKARLANLRFTEIPVSTVTSENVFTHSLFKYMIDVLRCVARYGILIRWKQLTRT